jgi:ATPase subunit of ABC transporter with duplicated ATPase domains
VPAAAERAGPPLLDEPTNHLDAESVAWLEQHLEEYKGTVVAVTHDRYFLDNVAGWILELDRGRGLPFKGNYSSWLEQKQARLLQEERSESARQRTIARELEWVRESPRGRQKKAKARLNNYERLLAEERNVSLESVQIHIPAGQRLGDVVLEASVLRKGFGDRLLIEDLSFTLPPAGIVGVIGPNGAGKTTLFRMIVGEEQPDAGSLRRGIPSSSPTSTSRATRSIRRSRSGRRSPTATSTSRSATAKSARAPTSPASTSAAPTSSARSACSPAASATACTWPSSCAAAATSCCSTSRPTTSTWTRCARSRRRCSTSRAAR